MATALSSVAAQLPEGLRARRATQADIERIVELTSVVYVSLVIHHRQF